MEVLSFLVSPHGLAAIGTLSSLGCLFVSSFPYFAESNRFSILRKSVGSVAKIPLGDQKNKDLMESKKSEGEMYWKELDQLLAHGEVMILEVKSKLVRRLFTSAAVYFGVITIVIQDGHNHLLPSTTGAFEFYDVFLVAFGGYVNYLTLSRDKLLDKEEKELLKQFTSLREYHYTTHVKPKIRALLFNLDILTSGKMPDLYSEFQEVVNKQGLMQNYISNLEKRLKEIESK